MSDGTKQSKKSKRASWQPIERKLTDTSRMRFTKQNKNHEEHKTVRNEVWIEMVPENG